MTYKVRKSRDKEAIMTKMRKSMESKERNIMRSKMIS